jgi:hypothetical protein
MQNELGVPPVPGSPCHVPAQPAADGHPQGQEEDFGRIDISRPKRALTVEFIRIGRRPARVSERWEE